jgi:amidase
MSTTNSTRFLLLIVSRVTVNPFNRTLTSGGSSGGEGALIGFRGSCLGIGTDIGGSIRSPAANNGLYGFKPTVGRLPMSGLIATMGGSEQVPATIGPLSTSLEGVKIFMQAIIDAKPWLKEPGLLPFEWKPKTQLDRKLTVAVMWDDGVVKPHPPVQRAMKEVVEKLMAKGNVKIVEWKPYKHDECWKIIVSATQITHPPVICSSDNSPIFTFPTEVKTSQRQLKLRVSHGVHYQNSFSRRTRIA